MTQPADNQPGAPAPTSTDDRIAQLREKRAAREAVRRIEQEAAEIERLELADKFEESLGVEGRAFVIVDVTELGEGFIVLGLGTDVQWNTFKASKMNVVDTEMFVFPCVVHPTKEKYREIAKRRPFVPERCAAALATLYGVKQAADTAK